MSATKMTTAHPHAHMHTHTHRQGYREIEKRKRELKGGRQLKKQFHWPTSASASDISISIVARHVNRSCRLFFQLKENLTVIFAIISIIKKYYSDYNEIHSIIKSIIAIIPFDYSIIEEKRTRLIYRFFLFNFKMSIFFKFLHIILLDFFNLIKKYFKYL
jgi:hypothetical protein